jgi:hypothetical protein
MKRYRKLFSVILIITTGFVIFSQEAGETPGMSGIPGEIKLPMGILNVRGLALAGLRMESTSQEGLKDITQQTDVDGNWRLDAINPIWEENRFDLYLDYSFLNYGVFLTTRFQSWAANNFGGAPNIRYVSVYGKFLEDKIKVSLGKLTNEIDIMPETKTWKTYGPGDMFCFTEDSKSDEHMSLRFEYRPIPQLNVGFQYFFVLPEGVGEFDTYWKKDFFDSGVWKEIGLAAEWRNDLFNAVAGVRFDSKGDPLTSYESYTYLRSYYGDSDYLGSGAASSFGPRYKYASEVIRQDPNANDPGFDGSMRAFFGFNIKMAEAFDIIGQGGFYNIAAWDKFGYARFNELVRYKNLGVKSLDFGLIMSQEFYGNDLFADDMVNSPFLTFGPEVSYMLVDGPGFSLKGTVTGAFGLCPDVTDYYIQAKPALNMMFGAFLVDIYYKIEATKYTGGITDRYGAPIKPETNHLIGLALMLMF